MARVYSTLYRFASLVTARGGGDRHQYDGPYGTVLEALSTKLSWTPLLQRAWHGESTGCRGPSQRSARLLWRGLGWPAAAQWGAGRRSNLHLQIKLFSEHSIVHCSSARALVTQPGGPVT